MSTRFMAAGLSTLLLTAGLTALAQPTLAAPSSGAGVHNETLVDMNPSDWTPHVNDGKVLEIAEVGDQVIVGGRFTSISQTTTSDPIGVDGVFGFAFGSGTLSGFQPSLDGEVRAILPGPQPGTVFIAGTFKNVNGVPTRLALLDAQTGDFVPGFNSAEVNGPIQDLALYGDELIVGGNFTYTGGQVREGLASLNVSTGDLTDFANLSFTGHHSWVEGSPGSIGGIGPRAIDVAGDRMVLIGNFSDVSGSQRQQIAMLDLNGGVSLNQDWNSAALADPCSRSFDSWVRDVEFSPDGSNFAVATTGGPYLDTLCDTVSHWDVENSVDAQPLWVNASGGDTLWGVTVSDSAVYVGGHQRWMNNIDGRDAAKPGAVPRPGIAAMDLQSGANVSWNPGRHPRGVAAFAVSATDRGVWIGSDTDSIGIGDTYELRKRIAFFPSESGTPSGTGAVPTLPAYLTVVDATDYPVSRTFFDGSDLGVAESLTLGELDPTEVRTAFRADGWLYYGTDSGLLHRRAIDRSVVGDDEPIDPYNDPIWSDQNYRPGGGTYRGSQPEIYSLLSSGSISGMSYSHGRLYFTLKGDGTVYHTGFAPESGIIEPFRGANPVRSLAGTLDNPEGLVIRDNAVYYVNGSTGELMSAPLADDAIGSSVVLSGNGDGRDWRGAALFLDDGPDTLPNLDPIATFSSDCDRIACSLDASASSDPDGQIDSYEWDLGDGNSASGVQIAHTYDAPGEYSVTLTVTDNKGAQVSQTEVVRAVEGAVKFVAAGSLSKNDRNFSVAIPDGAGPDDLAVALVTQNTTSGYQLGSGWSVISQEDTPTSRMFVAVAQVGDVSALDLTLDDWNKVAIQVLVYGGVDLANPVAEAASTHASSVTALASPKLTASSSQWAVSAWGTKSSSISQITAPSESTERSQEIGSGGGAASGLAVDSNGPASGPVGGQNASFDGIAGKAMSTTLLLNASSEAPPNVDPVAVIAESCTGFVCNFDGTGSSDPDGSVVDYDWDFGDGATASTAVADHDYGQSGRYGVTLTVTDNEGATNVASKTLRIGEANISFIGEESQNGSVKSFDVNLPTNSADGDLAVAILSHNTTVGYTLGGGWTIADEKLNGASRMVVAYAPVADVSSFDGALDEWNKADIQVLVYRGVDLKNPLGAVKFSTGVGVTELTAPEVSGDGAQWSLNAWGIKSADVTDITEPDGSVVRGKRIGTGGGAVSALILDSDSIVDGATGGLTASFTGTGNRVIAATLLVNGAI